MIYKRRFKELIEQNEEFLQKLRHLFFPFLKNNLIKGYNIYLEPQKREDFPYERWSIFNHLDNLNSALDAIKEYDAIVTEMLNNKNYKRKFFEQFGKNWKDRVQIIVTYTDLKGPGVIEKHRKLLFKGSAVKQKKGQIITSYVTREKLQQRVEEFNNGEYVLEDGLIIGLNRTYN